MIRDNCSYKFGQKKLYGFSPMKGSAPSTGIHSLEASEISAVSDVWAQEGHYSVLYQSPAFKPLYYAPDEFLDGQQSGNETNACVLQSTSI